MLRAGVKRVFSLLERFANRYGYRVRWTPPLFLRNPDAELSFDLEFVVAHLMLQKESVFFIQIGANDGKSHDPLYKFVTEFRWKGILVEPQPRVFDLLRANYAKCANDLTFINAAVSAEDGVRTLYTVHIDADTYRQAHFFSSFDKSVISRQTQWVPDIAHRIEEVPVNCISMDTLLREAEGREIDLLQIDAEGFDYEILKMVDFSKIQPAIICYEHAHLNKWDMQAASELLYSHGYRMSRDNLDTIAYRQTFTYGWRSPR
jgi:FkbM family methyltransferase